MTSGRPKTMQTNINANSNERMHNISSNDNDTSEDNLKSSKYVKSSHHSSNLSVDEREVSILMLYLYINILLLNKAIG